MKNYKILLADDHLIFQSEMEELINKRNGYKVAGKVDDVIDLFNAVKVNNPDLLVLAAEPHSQRIRR